MTTLELAHELQIRIKEKIINGEFEIISKAFHNTSVYVLIEGYKTVLSLSSDIGRIYVYPETDFRIEEDAKKTYKHISDYLNDQNEKELVARLCELRNKNLEKTA